MCGVQRACRSGTTTGRTTSSTPRRAAKAPEMPGSTEPRQRRAQVEAPTGQGLVITDHKVPDNGAHWLLPEESNTSRERPATVGGRFEWDVPQQAGRSSDRWRVRGVTGEF